jgi:hypothetical protein
MVWKVIFAVMLSSPGYTASQHEVYFAQTDYALDVYRIQGEQPGKTLLLIGGIQGDEPGGYHSADAYVDLTLQKGNLIIVPRANLKSIILGQRGPDGDMNRQFHDGPTAGPMQPVVEKLKALIAEADVFLNLHDGWGYHRPTYIDEQRNPKRYGQSLIVDTEQYRCTDGKVLPLGEIARQILQQVNVQITDPDHHLFYFNTKTNQPNTAHRAMRKTATYYALRKHCVPAYGVESSKNLPTLALKVKYHHLVINQFMRYLDIVPDMPQRRAATSNWSMVKLTVNGKQQYLFDGDQIILHPKDTVVIEQVLGDSLRGYTVDIEGIGGLQDQGKSVNLKQDSQIVWRKDQDIIGMATFRISEKKVTSPYFVLEKNGQPLFVPYNQSITLAADEEVIIRMSFGNAMPVAAINVKGWVPPKVYNRGDDRNYRITGRDRLQKKYSVGGRGERYPVVAENAQGQVMAKMFIQVEP